jgi:putative transposase
MVPHPADHPWSSWHGQVGERIDPLLTPHAEYLALGADAAARASTYRTLFDDALPPELLDNIRRHLRQQKALGTDHFRAWVEARTGRFAGLRSVGRPLRSESGNCP